MKIPEEIVNFCNENKINISELDVYVTNDDELVISGAVMKDDELYFQWDLTENNEYIIYGSFFNDFNESESV